MEIIDSSDQQMQSLFPDRPFECPCRKSYKSYPALYTHIKNKHNGIAPGSIKKPVLPSKKLGRPPSNKSRISIQTESFGSNSSSYCQFLNLEQSTKDLTTNQCIQRISSILQFLPLQVISKDRLHQIAAITEMTVYLATKRQKSAEKYIWVVIGEFLQKLAQCVEWSKFKYFYTLLMVFMQFIMDKTDNGSIIEQSSVNILGDFINDFLQNGVQDMTRYYQLDNLQVFQHDNMLNLFSYFFQWLMLKGYTSYKITLNQNHKPMESLLDI